MKDLRERIKERGWKQGSIIAASDLSIDPNPFSHYLILSQTCDVLCHNLKSEPNVELLPLKILPKQKPDKNLFNGFNPRRIQFQFNLNNKPTWVESGIKDLILLPRKELLDKSPCPDASILPQNLRDLCLWRAARYLRPAFPENFEEAFKLIKEDFKELAEEHHLLIDSMLIHYEPSGELATGEKYELQILLLMKPKDHHARASLDKINETALSMKKLLETVPDFDSPTVKIRSLDSLTLWEAASYIDWSRYDYLSFGEDEKS